MERRSYLAINWKVIRLSITPLVGSLTIIEPVSIRRKEQALPVLMFDGGARSLGGACFAERGPR